jgi:hemoglobin
MKAPFSIVLVTLSVGLAFMACGHKKPVVVEPVAQTEPPDAGPVDAAPPPTLYDKLGGKEGVSGIIDSFLGNITADKRVSKDFAKTTGPKLDHFKQMLADQICEAAGGGCAYSGKNMKDAHKGMGVTDAQFAAFVEDLTLALEEKQVGKEDQQALLDKLGAMKDDIVEKKASKK